MPVSHFFPAKKVRWLELLTIAFVPTALLMVGPAALANDDTVVVKTLTEQARFWEGKGRSDLAAAAWKRLLQIKPLNSEALAGLAQFELDNNRLDAAQAITEELKKQPETNREAIKRIEGAAAQKTVNTKLLDQARASARAGRSDEAVGLYQQVLDGQPLSGQIALEYYQNLGGTANGWEDARIGLEKLRADEPSNAGVALAYAQHLTYRAPTRREGIRLLTGLSGQPLVARRAIEAWRRALMWLEASKGDLSLFQAYLQVQPNDAAVRSRVTGLNQSFKPMPQDPRSIVLGDAFKVLNAGDVNAAEKQFESVLMKYPQNPDALGGLGVVRLKQERFAEAEKLLATASRIGRTKNWAEPLNTSRFWQAMQEGQSRSVEKRFDLANEAFKRAQKFDPNSVAAKVAQVGVLERLDRFDEAKSLIETIKDATERREAGQLLNKQKAVKWIEAKDYTKAELLLSSSAMQLDAEGKELLAWAQYHQGKLVPALSGFVDAYSQLPTKGSASGLVFSSHKLKNYQKLLASLQKDAGPLRELVSVSAQQKMTQGETRFELDSGNRIVELDPISMLTEDVLWPATKAYERENNPKKAYDMLLPHENKLIEIGDFASLSILGLAAAEVGDTATHFRTLKKAAEETEDEAYIFMWAQSLAKYGRDSEAEQVMLKEVKNLSATGLTLLGWTQYRMGKFDQAAEHFAAAYAKEPTESAAAAFVLSADKSNKHSLILTALDKNPNGPLKSFVAPEIRTEIAAGERAFMVNENGYLVALPVGAESAREGISLKFEPHLRGKSGEVGEGKLRQRGFITTLNWQGETHRASLEVEHQNATDEIERAKGQRWYAKWGMKMASSIDFQLGVGRTLGGGAVGSATVGEVGVGYIYPDGSIGGRIFRRGSEESLLALSGTSDAATGIRWGRVLERGFTVNANHKTESWSKLASLTVSRMEDGEVVASNRKVEIYGLALRKMDSMPGLSLGPEVYISRFGRKLSAFEPGHGGYYSPHSSITLSAYGRYEAKLGTVALTLTGGLGWGKNKEEGAAGNPITGSRPGQYPAATGSGLAYHGRVEGLQPLSPNWNLGFGLGMQRSSFFSDWRANMFVQRRWFK